MPDRKMIWLILYFALALFLGYKLRQASDALNRVINKNPK